MSDEVTSPGRSVFADLEDGALRRELGFAAPPPPAPPPPAVFSERLRFSGRGSEYFRIWVVHLLLMLLTLGAYSAWAKVRKARWFAQHTELMGRRFDFHGDPWRVLGGRVLAIALLVAWTQSFRISIEFGLTMLGVLCVLGPWLFAGAQRFRLANTSWCGLRFAFEASWRPIYVVCVPLVLLWTMGSVLAGVDAGGRWQMAAGAATLLGLPWAHARLKQLQHEHARFGTQRFAFEPAKLAFYGLYAKALALAFVAGMVVAVLLGSGSASVPRGDAAAVPQWLPMVTGLLLALLVWLCAWPYFAARAQQLVWSHTRWGEVRFRGEMKGWPLWKLTVGQTLLVLVTAGLYWPFAAVNLARYRVQSLVVEADRPIDEIVALAPPRGEQQAAGDAAADFFGLDLGW